MRLTFALTGNSHAQGIIGSERPPNVLCSQLWLRGLETLPYAPEYVMLDSGAFSAWNAGTPVRLSDYLPVAQKVQARWPNAHIVNLDVIPGEAGRTATQGELQLGMARSLENADALRAHGLRVIEVFHQNEPWSFLDTLLERRPDERAVVGVSPRNDVSVVQRANWLREVLGHLLARCGREHLPRTHGFAATSGEMLRAFPFYSADSSSWIAPYRYGRYIDENGVGTHVTAVLPGTRSQAGQDLLTRRSIRNLMQLGDEMTQLWARRGVLWSD